MGDYIANYARYARSNRTFMELKSFTRLKENVQYFCSNRTFMELKFLEIDILIVSCVGSNRTFMELKFLSCLHIIYLYLF